MEREVETLLNLCMLFISNVEDLDHGKFLSSVPHDIAVKYMDFMRHKNKVTSACIRDTIGAMSTLITCGSRLESRVQRKKVKIQVLKTVLLLEEDENAFLRRKMQEIEEFQLAQD
jgi:hypothetical protein